jgi:DUF4097 and DUF4098 domain-containing protein YvlB
MSVLRSSVRTPLAVACLLLAGASDASAHKIEKRFTVEMRPTLSLRNKSGKVLIKSWKRQEILVTANHVSEKTEVDAMQSGNRVEVVTHLLSENVGAAELEANYEISVPEETTIQLTNDSGDVFVERISGDMSFDTVAAGVDLREVAGYLVIKTLSGSLTCYLCAGRIEVNTISGNLRFLRPISNNVRVQNYSGSIFFDGLFERGGSYVLRNFTGPIEVRFSEGDSFYLKATTQQGKLESQASLQAENHSSFRPPKESKGIISGRVNLGLALVDLSSYSGTIRVLKRGSN